jgi:hypothetical protein
VQQRCGRIDGNGVNGLSKQLGLMPFVGGDQCGVVADRRVAFLLRLGPAARSETVAFMSVEQMMTLDEFGSQNGSQRLQLPGYAEPLPARVVPVRWPVRPHPAACSDPPATPEKRKVDRFEPAPDHS